MLHYILLCYITPYYILFIFYIKLYYIILYYIFFIYYIILYYIIKGSWEAILPSYEWLSLDGIDFDEGWYVI